MRYAYFPSVPVFLNLLESQAVLGRGAVGMTWVIISGADRSSSAL